MAEEKRDYKKLFEKMTEEIACPLGYYEAIGHYEAITSPIKYKIEKVLQCSKCKEETKEKQRQCWIKYLEGK